MKRTKAIFAYAILLSMLLTFIPLPTLATGVWNGGKTKPFGSGTTAAPYQISTGEELAWFTEKVNSSGGSPLYAELTADIMLNDTSNVGNWGTTSPTNTWIPIGNRFNPFVGSFHGNHHMISGVYVNSTENEQGLFGYLGYKSGIENVSLTDSYIKGARKVGGICGFSMSGGQITNCSSSASVTATQGAAGGICGYINSNNVIETCYNMGTITGQCDTGGIAGINEGTSKLNLCYNTGTIHSTDANIDTQFGGICGYNNGTISNSYNMGSVEVLSENNVGGICGTNYKTISNVFNQATVTGNSNVGFVCGIAFPTGTFTNCWFLGSSTDKGIANHMGSGTTTNSSSAGLASGEVAYLLGNAFGQTLGNDTTPVFRTGSNGVYKLTFMNGSSEFAVQYYNGGKTVSASTIGMPTSDSGIFTSWDGLPAQMPNHDVSVNAKFELQTVKLISAKADGTSGTADSTKIDFIFDSNVVGLTADNISITNGTGSAVKGVLSGSGTTYSIALTSVSQEGELSITVSAPTGYSITGSPVNVKVYKLTPSASISETTASFDQISPADVQTTITWNGATSVSDIKAGSISIGMDSYLVSGKTLTIKKEYLAKQATGSLVLTIAFDKGNAATFTINITKEPNPAGKTLKSIITPDAITGLTNGTAKTAAALGLPSMVTLFTSSGIVSTSVTWDVASCSYNASSSSAQNFTVNGTVTLPDGVMNPNHVPLSTSISVSVRNASSHGGGSSSGGESSTTQYTVSPDQGSNGTIKLSACSVASGTSVMVTVTPDKGYQIADVFINGVSVGAVSSYTIEHISKNTTVKAIFKKMDEDHPDAWVNPYSDLKESSWYYDSVRYVSRAGLMNGDGGHFNPNGEMTRAMIATVLYRLSGDSGSYQNTFFDMHSGAWYENAAAWAAKHGIASGIGGNQFAPESSITREQLAVMLYQYAKYKGLDVSIGANTNSLSYHDASTISSYAYEALQWACGAGIMNGNGNGNLNPQGSATRAEVAAMLQRAYLAGI
jgi:hypothetical protein